MRHLSSLLSSRSTPSRPVADDRRRDDVKRSDVPKPARKRCLNEAAHKLDR